MMVGARRKARVVHHHFFAARAVVEVVAGDAVHRRRAAGDDRHVVRIGEARHRGERGEIRAALHQPAKFGASPESIARSI
jgi:hypothetical protein